MNKKEIVISYSVLRKSALLFVALPLFCFFIGWLKWPFAVLSCLALLVCLLVSEENSKLNRLFKRKPDGKADSISVSQMNEKELVISQSVLVSIILISLIYLILCGIGRLWAQSNDYPWRNAIFRDLIIRKWPVFYDKYDGALCYYIGIWLPAAILGKLVFAFGANADIAFFAGNIAFLIYYTIGITILFLLLLLYFQATKIKHVYLAVFGFIFFSGMDILGVFILDSESAFNDMHLEWWSGFQYSSLTTCICWVFNQALIPWICMTLLLHEKKVSNFVFIGMTCLFCGPFPFIGFFIYCVAIGIMRFIEMLKSNNGKKFAGEVFSISNVYATLFIFPFIGLYLTSNTLMNNATVDGAVSYSNTWDFSYYFVYCIFMLIEFGIFALLIAKFYKRNILFYITVLQLMAYPFFDVGVNSDLSMRASIPAVFMMYVLCYQYVVQNSAIIPYDLERTEKVTKTDKFMAKYNIIYMTLIVCLVIGAVTPCFEFARGIDQVISRGINDSSTDYIISLNQDKHPTYGTEDDWPPSNFIATSYDDGLFFKYLARR